MTSDDKAIGLTGVLWMTVAGEHLGSHARIALLGNIEELGSITKAAKASKMSYKAAWDAVDTMNNLAGEPLVERRSGGRGGGGARLSSRGRQLVRAFHLIEREHQCFIERLARQADSISSDFELLSRLTMKTSARNHFFGKISAIQRGSVNDEVRLAVADGVSIVATLTHASVENLGLRIGATAFALIKASSVIVVTDPADARFSARNLVAGTVSRIEAGVINSEVVITSASGIAVTAIITNASRETLGLTVGKPALAMFKASCVIVGVTD